MPSKKINLLMMVHCHQPVGNFDGVFKEAYDRSYLPFIQALKRHPRIKAAMHYSGCLLDWIKRKHPEFLGILKGLVKTGQIEMMAGGYDEPVLSLIPDRDKFGQLKAHMDFIKRHMGCQPKGAWLTERVWEPYLSKIFCQAGLAYTLVDDSHFELTGKKAEEILGYYITEEDGFSVAIFPSSKKLRYSMPFKLPAETIDYLKSQATPEGEKAVTFGDDGEKFGLWPQTHKWVYEEGWLENFFRALEENSDWINIIMPSEYLKNHEPLGRIYLPCASYPEMLEWSGGYFRNFLVKYGEANWMHKRMLYVSEKIEAFRVEGSRLRAARESLYRAQCNCAYWHGIFGGLYLHHLRNAVYTNLIDAEKSMNNPGLARTPLRDPRILDIDKDGSDEIVLENGSLSVFIAPRKGANILELDYRPKSLNLINTLMRRKEAYHEKIKNQGDINSKSAPPSDSVASIHDVVAAKEKNLNSLLNYDRHQKSFLIDHFLSPDSNPENFSKAAFGELGDFADAPYKHSLKKSAGGVTASFERNGSVLTRGNPLRMRVEKQLRIESNKAGLEISYKLKNESDADADLLFGAELNLSLMDPKLYSIGGLSGLKNFRIEDEWFKVTIDCSFDRETSCWFYPIETVSESESGFEKTYQGLCLLFNWKMALKPEQAWAVDIGFSIK